MAHFAKIDENNYVVDLITLDNLTCGEPFLSFPETEDVGRAYIANILNLEGEWRQTSYNNTFRNTYGSIGSFYDRQKDIFVRLNEEEGE